MGTVGATAVALALAVGNMWARTKEKKKARAEDLKGRARVYAWALPMAPVKDHGGRVWIRNDTDLPIHSISYHAFTDKFRGKALNFSGSLLLPPRETRTFDIPADVFVRLGAAEVSNPWIHILLIFTDVDGYRWARHPNGDLTGYPFEGKTRLPITIDKGTLPPL